MCQTTTECYADVGIRNVPGLSSLLADGLKGKVVEYCSEALQLQCCVSYAGVTIMWETPQLCRKMLLRQRQLPETRLAAAPALQQTSHLGKMSVVHAFYPTGC